MPDYNGEMFRLARQYRDLTQRELAESVGTEASTVSRIENCLLQPSEPLAERLADRLRFPLSFFRQAERPYGLPVSVHPMWRKKAAVGQREIDRALAAMNIWLMHLRRLIKAVEFRPVLPLPEVDVETFDGGPEAVAQLVRRAWLMPAGPVRDLTAWVERAGCFVAHVEMPDAAMDGLTLRSPDLPPCIFLNKHLPGDRLRYTLCHELGHVIMHRLPTMNMEREANAFAGAFLMPANDIRRHFAGHRITLSLLANLKPEWRVAMQSLLFRAGDLGYVKPNQARYLWSQFNAQKIRMREPPELDVPVEQPTLAPRVIQLHLEQLGYSVAELEKVIDMYEEEIPAFHNLKIAPPKPQLRLV